jgi:hypothetical protein
MSRSKIQLIIFACCVSSAASSAAAQVVVHGTPVRSPQEYQRLSDNTRKLQVTLHVDKEVYFPNEDATLTITITNPGATPIEVLEPLSSRTGGVNVYFQGDPAKPASNLRSWRRLSPHPYGGPYEGDGDAPAVWIFPGQPATKKCIVSDPSSRAPVKANGLGSMSVCDGFGMMEYEGDYQIRYNYGPGAAVGFRVVWPQFEQWTQVRFAEEAEPKASRGPVYSHIGRFLRFAVLGYQSSHIIIVALNISSSAPPRPDASGRFTGDLSREFSPFRRIATSAVPITSLQAVADNSENITLAYKDQTGRSVTIKLNANRELVP